MSHYNREFIFICGNEEAYSRPGKTKTYSVKGWDHGIWAFRIICVLCQKKGKKKKNLLYILELCFLSEKKKKNELKQYLGLGLGK